MTPEELKQSIAELPTGGITVKKIKNQKTGVVYEYHVYQWSENGRQKSRYLKEDELELLESLLEERRSLEALLREKESSYCIKTEAPSGRIEQEKYLTDVQTGEALKRLLTAVAGLKKREIICSLEDYVFGREFNRVFILYGLRRTGKTTMMKQVIAEMTPEQFQGTAFIQLHSSQSLAELNQDLKHLAAAGYRYIFLDEVTLLGDFIEGAALLSDIYAASGMKLVLSGTDSLGFRIAGANELYDRCHLLHTTFISYREFENVLGIRGIDRYIQYGGTMSVSGSHYNAFAGKNGTDEYVDSAIAHNIQHSLQCYQEGEHFRHLYSLYEHRELTGAINRVVEDMNHRFTVEVLTREFKSGDLSLSARNLLEILNRPEQTVAIDEVHTKEIEEYLGALDLFRKIPVVDIENYGQQAERTVFTQAGLRYCQAKSLVEALLQDAVFAALSFQERKAVNERILHEIQGRMLEDIILLETAMANPDKEVFKLQFADGEYDMVVADSRSGGCFLYEIKYSDIVDSRQYRHLIDEAKARKTEFRYGEILGRTVLYRGKSQRVNGIDYQNAEEYLKDLPSSTAL